MKLLLGAAAAGVLLYLGLKLAKQPRGARGLATLPDFCGGCGRTGLPIVKTARGYALGPHICLAEGA